jgi:hypothetical protein
MADDTLSGENFLRDVQAFVAEKWLPHHPCDRCGTFHWSILPGNAAVLSVHAMTPRAIDSGQSSPGYEVEFIPIYCNNCGNTINIYIGVFMEWVMKRQTT